MTEKDRDEGATAKPFSEILARLAEQGDSVPAPARTEVSERVELVIGALRQAVLDDWPTVEELRELPPDEYSRLVRELSLAIDRLTALRVQLLSGRGPRL